MPKDVDMPMDRLPLWSGQGLAPLVLGLGLIVAGCGAIAQTEMMIPSPEPEPTAPTTPTPPVYTTLDLKGAVVHIVTVPDPVMFPVRVAVTDHLALVGAMAVDSSDCPAADCAIAAINAGFFDPNNAQTTSYVVVNGQLAADPRQNQRLMGNPDLTSYLDQILNRSEFRRYDCGGRPSYDITFHQAPTPADCTLVDVVGAGPQLLPQSTAQVEGFIAYGPDGVVSRDALGSTQPNARSAVGLKADGSVVLMMVAQVPDGATAGLGIDALATVMQQQGAVKAINLDGGSSATLVYQGTTHYGRLDAEGKPIQRPVKSILWVGSTPTNP